MRAAPGSSILIKSTLKGILGIVLYASAAVLSSHSQLLGDGAGAGFSGQADISGLYGIEILHQSTICYIDSDGDGYGDSADPGTDVVGACGAGFSSNNLDCDDSDSLVNPAAVEVCDNGIDDNCNGNVDEECCPIPMTGDLDGNSIWDSRDLIAMVNYIFKSGPTPPPCPAIADLNCDGTVDAGDIIKMVSFLYRLGWAPCDVCTIIPTIWSCP